MARSTDAADPPSDKRWVAVPLIFALCTAAVFWTLRSFAERIPELQLVGPGLDLASLKVVVSGVTSVMKEDLLQLAGLLAVLFL